MTPEEEEYNHLVANLEGAKFDLEQANQNGDHRLQLESQELVTYAEDALRQFCYDNPDYLNID